MKAVILAGGQNTSLNVLTKYYPKQMLPVANRPLLCYLIDSLKSCKITELIITVAKTNNGLRIADYFEDGRRLGVEISYSFEEHPRGTAGILKDVRGFLENEHFLVADGSVFLNSDLNGFLRFHHEKKSVATVGVINHSATQHFLEGINTTADNKIKDFTVIHHSKDKRHSAVSSGVYFFSPQVFNFINGNSYMDIKEQLIPSIQKAGLPIHSYPVKGYHKRLNCVEDYFALNQDFLRMEISNNNGKKEITDRIWLGENVEISSDAYLLGPLIIGDNCRIEANCHVIGPAIIGEGCRIRENSLVRESVIWRKVSLSESSKIEYCIIKDNVVVPKNSFFQSSVIMDEALNSGDMVFLSPELTINNIRKLRYLSKIKVNDFSFYPAVKRGIDIIISLIGSFLGFPIFIILALAIKLESPGPIFYLQKRCGKGGREFKLYKLRSMVVNAEAIHKNLLQYNEVDGPMFKLTDDPRLTRIGFFLRKTSLDEIPQLLNVFMGQMSIVGPRPLVMEEMKFSPSWRDARLKVKPGITGLWQINGRSESTFSDWINYDLYYVKNQSLRLDLLILIKTITCVLKGIGAK